MKIQNRLLGVSRSLKLACLAVLALTTQSFGTVTATFSASGSNPGGNSALAVSATAQFSITRNVGDSFGTLTITLTNTTPVTRDAAQLLTGVDFSLTNGNTAITSLSLTSATGEGVTISETTFKPISQGVGPIEWNPVPSTINTPFQLRWNGDNGNGAQDYGIIGLPDGAGGEYTTINSGLITGNHSPFTYYQGVFVLTSPNLFETTILNAANIRFGTGADSFNLVPVPEPTSAMVFGLGLGLACLTYRLPRRAVKQ